MWGHRGPGTAATTRHGGRRGKGARILAEAGLTAGMAIDDAGTVSLPPRGARSYASAGRGVSRRESTREVPSVSMATPYRVSATSIVRRWWVMTMNWVMSW